MDAAGWKAGAPLLRRSLSLDRAPIAERHRSDHVRLGLVLTVGSRSKSLSDAGRVLFAASRAKRTSVNDADRLRKYLARFGLVFEDIRNI